MFSLLALEITICLVVPAGFHWFKGQDHPCKFWWISLRGYRPSSKHFCASPTCVIPLLGNVHYPLTFTTTFSAISVPRSFHSCSPPSLFPHHRCSSIPCPGQVSLMSCRVGLIDSSRIQIGLDGLNLPLLWLFRMSLELKVDLDA